MTTWLRNNQTQELGKPGVYMDWSFWLESFIEGVLCPVPGVSGWNQLFPDSPQVGSYGLLSFFFFVIMTLQTPEEEGGRAMRGERSESEWNVNKEGKEPSAGFLRQVWWTKEVFTTLKPHHFHSSPFPSHTELNKTPNPSSTTKVTTTTFHHVIRASTYFQEEGILKSEIVKHQGKKNAGNASEKKIHLDSSRKMRIKL